MARRSRPSEPAPGCGVLPDVGQVGRTELDGLGEDRVDIAEVMSRPESAPRVEQAVTDELRVVRVARGDLADLRSDSSASLVVSADGRRDQVRGPNGLEEEIRW